MISSTLVIFTSNVAQALSAVLLAIVLVVFHRHYPRAYLLTWAWSWWAFCASLVSGSAELLLIPRMPPEAPARLAAAGLFLLAGYWQGAWLLFGTYEVVTERSPSRRLTRSVLAALVVLAFGCVGLSLYAHPGARLLARLGVRSLVLGVAFLITAWGVWRSPAGRSSGLGRRLVSGAFLLYGLRQLLALAVVGPAVFGTSTATAEPVTYAAGAKPFDFLLQALIGIGMVIWLLEDERERMVAASARIEHLAHHDPLTDLPNRTLLLRHLQEAIGRAEVRRERLAVLFFDLDRFKVVNESLSNRDGDELLKAFSQRLRQNLRTTDQIARLAADEFAVVLPALESEIAMIRVAEKILAVTRLPFALQGGEVYVTASLGISRCPEDGTDAETLLKHAEIAMVRAKEVSRDQYQIYSPGMGPNRLDQLSLETDLRKALTQDVGELALFYQPVLDTRRRKADGVEALLRWFHPVRGLMTPAEFLWLAEVSGLATVLDLWVLRTACREAEGWRRAGGPDLQLAVNLSPRSFQQADLFHRIRNVLAETAFPPSLLVLEITETLAMQNAEATLAVLRSLKELGVRIAIDDFGTGYSSLSYLTTFPIDTLKVDRSFVLTIGQARGSEEVAAAVIALALSLEIDVIAEGVETAEQLGWLQGLGCERFQGYLFSHPLPADDCRDLMRHGDLEARIPLLEPFLTPA
jgi:diguanylate cyclase (GGDEF)-like protein